MKKASFIFNTIIVALALITVTSCNRNRSVRADTPKSGIAEIVSDECFASIIQQQVDVFEATNPDATIIPVYTSELEAFRLFMDDSIRLIIASRELTDSEKQIMKDRRHTLRSQRLAIDGIALIVNKNNADTLMTVQNIKKIMTGEVKSWKEINPNSKLGDISIVFDSPNSSTVRYIKDSICKEMPLGTNLKAMVEDSFQTIDINTETPNQKVISHVASNPNALGVIGVSWISNPADSLSLSFINDIRVMSLSNESEATARNSYKPYAAYLVLKKYPLTRDIFIIISDPPGGLPSGFVSFSAGEKGQRIIHKAGLYPATVPTRLVNVTTSF